MTKTKPSVPVDLSPPKGTSRLKSMKRATFMGLDLEGSLNDKREASKFAQNPLIIPKTAFQR